MNIKELKLEVERLTAGPIPEPDWDYVCSFLYPNPKEVSLPEHFTHTLAKMAAEEYKKRLSAPPSQGDTV